jgi:replicative DNA helicase
MAAEPNAKPRPIGRVLPHNVQAEQSVLGSAMSGERQLAEITALLKTEDFYRPDHRLVYDAICELYLSSKPVDILTVADLLESKSLLEKAGGIAYISGLPDAIPVMANAMHYAAPLAGSHGRSHRPVL